ncbi:MAG: hypothetical protein SAMD01599839_05800 [Rectinema sp.]
MTILEVLERIQSLLALRLDAEEKQGESAGFMAGYAAGVKDCLKTIDALIAAGKKA